MKKILFALVLISLLALPVVGLAQVADIKTKINKLITDVLQPIIVVVAILFAVLAAFNFLTAAGDPEKVKSARNFILYALVGVIVAYLAGAIVTAIETAVK